MEEQINEILKSNKYFLIKKESIFTTYIFSDLEFNKVTDDCIKVIGTMECFYDDNNLEFLKERPTNKVTILSARKKHLCHHNDIYEKLFEDTNKLVPLDDSKFEEIKKQYGKIKSLLKELEQ